MVDEKRLAATPEPPYYAVIFTSQRSDVDADYGRTAERMLELAARQPGFLGVDSVRAADGKGVTVSYWRDEASIRAWKHHMEHSDARSRGRSLWYERYTLRVARVERDYTFERKV